jgi:glycosyltransferase involved in cell wall biosynthesis
VGKLAVLDPLLALRFRQVVGDRAFDVVHAHHYEGLLVAASVRGLAAPVVYDAHTVLETELPSYGRWLPAGLVSGLGRRIDGWLPPKARFVVAVSERLRAHLLSTGAVEPERIEVVGNGVDLSRFPSAPPREGPEAGAGVLVYAGNLAPYQGIDHLLMAFRRVLDRRQAAQLRILTDSDFTPFEALAGRLGIRERIEVSPAPLSVLHHELSQAHVALNPRPRCDGVPQKNLNYMAAATALVGFEHSVQPCRHGHGAVAVPEVSGEALGDAVLELLDRPEQRQALGRAARTLLEQEYTWDRQAARLVDIYHQLVGAPPPGGGGMGKARPSANQW